MSSSSSADPASSIRLYRTSFSLLNGKYTDASGQVIYRVHTPGFGFRRTTTITRLLNENQQGSSSAPDDRPPAYVEVDDDDDDGGDDTKTIVGDDQEPGNEKQEEAQLAQEVDLPEITSRYGHLATIEHNPIAASVLTWGGRARTSRELFKRDWAFSMLALARDRVWTASDGVEYRWKLHNSSMLYLNNEPKTIVARYRRKRLLIPRKAPEEAGPSAPGINVKKTACLEIFPAGRHIQDEIFITFVYIEKLRADKEAAAASS